MDCSNNDYWTFVADLEVDDLSKLRSAISRIAFEGISLEGKVQEIVVNDRIYVIPRGDDRILLYDQRRKQKVWINKGTSSESVFKDILHEELMCRIAPFNNVESYYCFKECTDPD